jgi:L-rhamnose mutarotase
MKSNDGRQAAMETIAFRMVLNPGMREEYERRHREIWPELVVALHEAGVRDYRIFFDAGTDHLFAILTRTSDHHMDRSDRRSRRPAPCK